MTPEMVRGQPVDRRSDVFALGVVLHEMLTGARLFAGRSELSVLERVRRAEVPPPSGARPDLPAGLEEVVLRALAREPGDRYGWASELRDALLPYAEGGLPPGEPPALARLMALTFPRELHQELDRIERVRAAPPPPAGAGARAGADPGHRGPAGRAQGARPPRSRSFMSRSGRRSLPRRPAARARVATLVAVGPDRRGAGRRAPLPAARRRRTRPRPRDGPATTGRLVVQAKVRGHARAGRRGAAAGRSAPGSCAPWTWRRASTGSSSPPRTAAARRATMQIRAGETAELLGVALE